MAMIVLSLLLAYLVGSLPLGYWTLKTLSGREPRLSSVYNLGLENALKLMGPTAVLASSALDVLKGLVAVGLGSFAAQSALAGTGTALPFLLLTALSGYLGHLYPLSVFSSYSMRGRGGMVLAGVVAGLAFWTRDYTLAVFPLAFSLVILAFSRHTSLAALGIPLALALTASFGASVWWAKLAAWALFGLAFWRYKENIGRVLEGTETRLGSPPPMPSEKQVVCAFMIHPLTLADLWQSPRFRWAKTLVEKGLIPARMIEHVAEWFRPMKVGELYNMRTADGREIRCYLISAPLLPQQITGKPELAARKAIQGARLARELGASVFGLGAFWSVVGDKGLKVQEAVPEIEVTNGGAYTAGTVRAAIPKILEHFQQSGSRLQNITAAVVGANGVVAFGIARQIAPLVGKLILVGRNLERLEKSAESLRKNLERKGQATEMVLSTEVTAIREADLVFSATSDPNPVILPEHVKPGAWIYDEGIPPDVHEDVWQVPSVRIIPGGVVRPPGAMQGNIDLHFGTGAVPACLAETMILAAEKAYARKSLGGETKSENIQFFVERAEALGFKVVD